MLLQQLVNGVILGSVYGLVALGYTMVYGIIRLINFAQGSLYTVGAYIALLVLPAVAAAGVKSPAAELVIVLVASMGLTGLVGLLVELVAYRPLRNAPLLAPLVSSLAAMVLLENVIQVVIGAQPETYPTLVSQTPWVLGPISIAPSQLLIVVVSMGLMIGMQPFIQRTNLGRAMRAVAISRDTAELMGINANRVIALTFFVGGALGAAGGVLVGINYGTITFNMGELAGLYAFTAAVLGGIGNIPGALVGGLVLGLLQSFATVVLPTQWNEFVVFAVLILLLTFRPQGILGERLADRA